MGRHPRSVETTTTPIQSEQVGHCVRTEVPRRRPRSRVDRRPVRPARRHTSPDRDPRLYTVTVGSRRPPSVSSVLRVRPPALTRTPWTRRSARTRYTRHQDRTTAVRWRNDKGASGRRGCRGDPVSEEDLRTRRSFEDGWDVLGRNRGTRPRVTAPDKTRGTKPVTGVPPGTSDPPRPEE